MRNWLLFLIGVSVLPLCARHGVHTVTSIRGLRYHLENTRAVVIYISEGQTTMQKDELSQACRQKQLCYVGCHALILPFDAPKFKRFYAYYGVTQPGTVLIFWDGRMVASELFAHGLSPLSDYVMRQIGDAAQALVDELGLDVHYHARQRSNGMSWYWGGYYAMWGDYPAWGSQPWGAFSLGMGFRRPQN